MAAVDRRERARLYKDAARPMGVYRVHNVAAHVSLLGTSVDVPAMLNRQRFQLEMASHPNRALQADFAMLGPDAFVFETLDVLEPPKDPDADPRDDLVELELMWRERLASAGESLYNAKPGRLT